MEHIVPHLHKIKREDRMKVNGHNSFLVWFTGLSGSGKSTIASKVEEKLHKKGVKTYILDGDNVRAGLNRGLGFSDEDRMENLRRIGEVAKLFIDAGIVVLAAFISPKEKEREMVKEIVGKENFVQVFVDCSIEVCEERDVKGLYKKARKGEIKNFIGIDIEYEKPKKSEIIIKSDEMGVDDCADKIIESLLNRISI